MHDLPGLHFLFVSPTRISSTFDVMRIVHVSSFCFKQKEIELEKCHCHVKKRPSSCAKHFLAGSKGGSFGFGLFYFDGHLFCELQLV